MMNRGESYWNATAEAPDFPALTDAVEVDVAIIGGGIVGVTAARLLKDRGAKVALIEGRRVGRGVTGRSTAKMTSQHGLIYAVLEQKFGGDCARLYGEAQEAGIRKIVELANAHAVDADIEPSPAFVFTRDPKLVSDIEQEAEAAGRYGLPAALTRDTGLPFEVEAAVRFDDQAQFHPTKYVAGLAQTIPGDGCHLFENSRVVDWEPTTVRTDAGQVRASVVVMASHLPLGQTGGFYTEAAPYAEPMIAAPIADELSGMYKSAERRPSHSVRTHRGANGRTYAVAAGTSFKPGHVDEEREYFADLERWLTDNFPVGSIEYRWVNEDYTPIDMVPFVGWSSSARSKAYLVATGFKAWGISNGTAAAMILADLASGTDGHPWLSLFDATRIDPIAGGKQFLSENAKVASHLVGGYLARKPHSFDELAPGDAAILKVDGHNVAAYRDEQGTIHSVSAVCSHMGCIVGWNENDRTWDCPCHGSRFALDGRVIHGPATQPLGSKVTG